MAVINRTQGGFAGGTTHNITIPAVASGNHLLVVLLLNPTSTPSGMTDNGGGSPTYTLDVDEATLENVDAVRLNIFRRNNITSGPTQVSFTTEAAAFVGSYQIIEYDNLADAGPTQSNIATRAFATTNTATVTTATANEIGIAVSSSGNNSRIHTGSAGYTGGHPDDSTTIGARIFDNPDLGAAGEKSFVATINTAQWLVPALYTYAASGGGGGGSTILPLLNAYYG